jgi:hypothetical protein
LRSEPLKNLYIGAHVFNPTKAKIAEYDDERIPTIFRIGLGYNFSDKVLVSIESEKDIEYDPSFKFGIEVIMKKYVYLRAGISTNPVLNTFGIGYALKRFKVDIAFSKHPVLDYTSHISMSYSF